MCNQMVTNEIRNNCMLVLFKPKTLCERTLRRRGCGIYGECGGIVRNAIWWGKVSIMSMEGMEW